jgi:hypothetical protein
LKALIISLALFFATLNSYAVKSDTIDYWQVKLNGKIINPNPGGTFDNSVYSITNISDSATLEIGYYTDSPCPSKECVSKLELKTKNGLILEIKNNSFDNTPFQISGKELKKLFLLNSDIYVYFSGKKGGDTWDTPRYLGILTKK